MIHDFEVGSLHICPIDSLYFMGLPLITRRVWH